LVLSAREALPVPLQGPQRAVLARREVQSAEWRVLAVAAGRVVEAALGDIESHRGATHEPRVGTTRERTHGDRESTVDLEEERSAVVGLPRDDASAGIDPDSVAKLWLQPVSLAFARGFNPGEVARIREKFSIRTRSLPSPTCFV
jgi:hypothetical protein